MVKNHHPGTLGPRVRLEIATSIETITKPNPAPAGSNVTQIPVQGGPSSLRMHYLIVQYSERLCVGILQLEKILEIALKRVY